MLKMIGGATRRQSAAAYDAVVDIAENAIGHIYEAMTDFCVMRG